MVRTEEAPALAGAALAAARRCAPAPAPTTAVTGPDVASSIGVSDGGGPLPNGGRDLAGALAIAAAIEAGVIVVLLLRMRRRRRADVSACRDLVEIAHLTRAGATREMGRLLAREIATPLTSALNNLGAARRLLLRDPPQLEEISAAVGEAQSAGRRGGRAPPARLAVAGRDRRRRSRRPERGGARGRPAGRGGSQSGRGRRAVPAARSAATGSSSFRWCSSCS